MNLTESPLYGFIYNLALGIPGFLVAIIFHEWAHAMMAFYFGDDTAKRAGRLTLNPAAHMDILGTVIFPMIGAATGSVMFGWARPVPVDPIKFKKMKSGLFWVSAAGPLMNVILGIVFAFAFAFVTFFTTSSFEFHEPLKNVFHQAVMINFLIAGFNLIPLQPLDGSKILSSLLSYEAQRKYDDLSRYGIFIFLFLLFTGLLNIILYPAMLAAKLSLQVASAIAVALY